MKARVTHEEATTDDVMRRLDDLSNRLFTIGLAYNKLEAKSSVYLSSHQRGTDDNYCKPRDRCSYSTRCPQRPVFPRDVSRHHTSVPNRSNRNFGTSSRLSNSFGAPSCTITHGRIQRVNRRHSPRIQYNGPCRHRLEPAKTDDRRGVDMWDHRRYGNGNDGKADMNNGAWDEHYEQYHEADHNNYVYWRRGPNGDANSQSMCQLFKKKSPVSQNNKDMNASTTYIQRYVPDTNNIGDQNTLNNKVNKQYVNSVTIDTGNCTDNKVKNSNTLQSKVNVITLKENKININISGRVSPALIDSGAAICCIRKQFLESFPVCIKKNVMSSDIDRCTLADKGTTRILGKIWLRFAINGVTYHYTFHIIESLTNNVILGIDFLMNYLASINFEQGTITLNNIQQKNADVNRLRESVIQLVRPCHSIQSRSLSDSAKIHVHTRTHTDRINESDTQAYRYGRAINNNDTVPLNQNVELLNFKDADLNESQIADIKIMFNNYSDVLSSTTDQIGKINFFKYDIKLPENTQPIRRRPYTVSMNDKSILKSEIDKLLKAKIIKRNLSPWSLPVLLVSKRDTEEKRLCINMQEVNKLLPVPQYYIPNIDYLLTNLGNQKSVIFSKLDCKNAYNQIELTGRASEICSFSTHLGSFSYTRCPFGINQIPAVFMSLMQQILGHLDNVYIYLDDILLASTSFEEHMALLEEVLLCLRKAGMTLSPSKTFIGVKEVEYIGYVIDKNGVRNAPHNLGKVIKFERPSKVSQLRKWLGMCSFQRRFIPNYSGLAKILYEKTSASKHSKLVWSDEMIKSYEKIKTSVANSPKLGIVQFHNPNPIILSTDASDHAIGFNIKQSQLDEKTDKFVNTYLFFGGKNLVGSSRNWAIYKKELYAVVTALQRLESYLKPKLFHIYVDNLVVYYYLTKVQPDPPAIIARWLLYLNDFRFKVFHKKGSDSHMYLSDLISRSTNIEDDKAAGHIELPIDAGLNAITTNPPTKPFAHT